MSSDSKFSSFLVKSRLLPQVFRQLKQIDGLIGFLLPIFLNLLKAVRMAPNRCVFKFIVRESTLSSDHTLCRGLPQHLNLGIFEILGIFCDVRHFPSTHSKINCGNKGGSKTRWRHTDDAMKFRAKLSYRGQRKFCNFLTTKTKTCRKSRLTSVREFFPSSSRTTLKRSPRNTNHVSK